MLHARPGLTLLSVTCHGFQLLFVRQPTPTTSLTHHSTSHQQTYNPCAVRAICVLLTFPRGKGPLQDHPQNTFEHTHRHSAAVARNATNQAEHTWGQQQPKAHKSVK